VHLSAKTVAATFGLAVFLTCSALAGGRAFDFQRDTLAFANDTLRIYSFDAAGTEHAAVRSKPPEYSRHCLVIVRAVLQFHKFASFDAAAPRVSDAEYRRLVKRIARIPAWLPSRENRIVIPGYADLRSFSAAKAGLLQDELGLWWATYWRVGNWQMACCFPRFRQQALAKRMVSELHQGVLPSVFLTRFRPLNHAVIPFRYHTAPDGNLVFDVYDPNNISHPVHLTYDTRDRSFTLEKTGYWKGGRVNAFRIYHSLLQ
jgi:hypothetical protein